MYFTELFIVRSVISYSFMHETAIPYNRQGVIMFRLIIDERSHHH